MKEFVLVEFLFTEDEYFIELDKLKKLGDDFMFLTHDQEWDHEENIGLGAKSYWRVIGQINSMTASMIKLKNPVLSGKMRVSYISDELKNKYRK